MGKWGQSPICDMPRYLIQKRYPFQEDKILIPELRTEFNKGYLPEKYAKLGCWWKSAAARG